MDDTKKFEDRLAKYDQEWNGPKLHVLLIVTLAVAIAVVTRRHERPAAH